jgi:putative N6-adenine-specific DNA methylase
MAILVNTSRPGATSYLCFVQVAPGLEPFILRELSALVKARFQVLVGGVEARLSAEELYLVCAASRLAEGVRVRLKAFGARSFAELEAGLRKLPWRAYLSPGLLVDVRVTCEHSRLWHSGAVQQRVESCLGEAVGARSAGVAVEAVDSDETEQPSAESTGEPLRRIFVRLVDDQVQVSVDAAGERLHRRGYRKRAEKASLRETLASAMVFAMFGEAGPHGTLWDPFAGAGTIVLEALARSHGGLAQTERRFLFEDWPALARTDFQELARQAEDTVRTLQLPTDLRVIGSDIAPRAIQAARANLKELTRSAPGVDERATFIEGDLLEVEPQVPRGAFILTNPPYGRRLGRGDVLEKLEQVLARRPDLRPCAVLVGGESKQNLPSNFRVAFQTKNGGVNVALRVRA